MRRTLVIAGCLPVAAAIVIGILQSGGSSGPKTEPLISAADAKARLQGSPAQLAAIHAQANEIVGGSEKDYSKRVSALKGTPIVVNAWGAWCTPCRQEMPLFNSTSVRLGRRVAFLGLDVEDNDDNARAFLEHVPVSYPSYSDPDRKIASSMGLAATPSTIFYDRRGRQTIHQGPYTSAAELVTDIRRYAQAG